MLNLFNAHNLMPEIMKLGGLEWWIDRGMEEK
jgi:hypothetical protein